jgi:hypothetical protein
MPELAFAVALTWQAGDVLITGEPELRKVEAKAQIERLPQS